LNFNISNTATIFTHTRLRVAEAGKRLEGGALIANAVSTAATMMVAAKQIELSRTIKAL